MQYTEKTPKAWSATCIAIYLAGIGYMGIDTIPDEFGLWLGLSALFLLVLLPCLAVPFSKFIFNRVQIDSQTLRVGRERFALTDIDPASVRAATHTGGPTTPQDNARLVGGGWAVPMGMASAVITTRQGEHLTIATRDRAAFLTALVQATGS